MKCKNCGHTFEGNFCDNCGQSAKVERINFSNFISEVSETIFQVNRGFFFTLKELFKSPGKSLRDFLEGKRKSHFKPIAYLLILSTIYILATRITDTNTLVGYIVEGWMIGASDKGSDAEIPRVANWLLTNYAYLTLLLIPVFSLASYISFSTFRKTYLEHVVINSYITGQQAIIYSVFTIAGSLLDSEAIAEVVPLVLAVSYTFWVFWSLFDNGHRVINVLRSVLTYVLYTALSSGLLALLI